LGQYVIDITFIIKIIKNKSILMILIKKKEGYYSQLDLSNNRRNIFIVYCSQKKFTDL